MTWIAGGDPPVPFMPIEHGSSASLQERAYGALLDSMGDAVLGWGPDGAILFCNPAAATLLQRSAAQLIGRPISSLGLSGEDGPAWKETALRRADGTRVSVVARFAPFSDEDGRPAGVAMLARPRAHRAADGAGELERFSSAAAHDLLEPLRKISAFSELLKKQAKTALDGRSLDFLERIRGSAARMTRLIEDVAVYSRLISDERPFERVELKDVVSEALRELAPKIKSSQARVEVGELPALRGNPAALRRLFHALLDNALKFQPAGNRPNVRVAAARPRPGVVEISVADNGIGFDQKDAQRILEPFQRLHTRAEFEGSGLGLAGCRRVARRHGGDIRAVSEKGKGATFYVTFPEEPR